MAAVMQALGRQALGMACTCTWQALGREGGDRGTAAARAEVQAATRTRATVVRACASRRATRSPVAAGLAAAAVLTRLVVWAQGGDGSQCERRAAHGGAA